MKLHSVFILLFMSLTFSFTTNAQGYIPRFQKHTMAAGETAAGIAANFHIDKKDFLMLNNFPASVKLKPGQVVLIKQLNNGEQEIEEVSVAPKTSAAKTWAPVAKKEEPVTRTKTVAEPHATPPVKKETPAEEKFVVPPPSTKAVEVGPHGTKYNVSKTGEHVVERGQTFFRIALIYGLSVEELQQLNGLSNTTIELGQKLKVKK